MSRFWEWLSLFCIHLVVLATVLAIVAGLPLDTFGIVMSMAGATVVHLILRRVTR